MNHRDAVRAHFEGRRAPARRALADVVQAHVSRTPPAIQPAEPDTKAAVLARFRRSPVPTHIAPDVRRQIRRILESMREFGFEPGGYWCVPQGREQLEDGWTPRHGGDPINTTIQEVAGVYATRADVIEAADAILADRQPQLAPRHLALVGAVVTVASALAGGKRVVSNEGGTIRIQGPTLPPNWDA